MTVATPAPHAPAPPAADSTRVPATAAAARARVCDLLRRAGISLDSVTAADTLLVTSELVTNAIRHGGGLTAFHTEIADDTLLLSVADANPHAPEPRTGTPDRPGGYGWPLIKRLTERVDIRSHLDGKTISAELRLA
ncbi:ATP-binding protein [Streptomyces sp. H27-H5]|uniref:ATP-binding protein n=1 Tax=Streptomyces sp. H27-H5 TaxID=2996460 RepID=UPI002270239E|nr:ATP-binding protein [Streptomyces sp. H27-H5]MCY0963440.1 ATP-binding protein [Streptomyces sp. H27-H5]